jgi:hypothetical protein
MSAVAKPTMSGRTTTSGGPVAMFTVYALNIADNEDTEAECETLDEALLHLRELITNELEADEGPAYDRYGIAVDQR